MFVTQQKNTQGMLPHTSKGSQEVTHVARAPMFGHTAAGYVTLAETGDAVTHPALTNLPFAKSIAPWVQRYFPDAALHVIDDAVSDIAPPSLAAPVSGVLALQAAKGLGKSKAIRAAVAALPPSTSVVQITFLRSLAYSSTAKSGAGWVLYSDLQRGTSISARATPRLTIVVNSVARIRGSYEVVVIDELVSVLDMLAGPLLTVPARVQAVHTLSQLIAAARVVVVADANLDAAALRFVLTARRVNDCGAVGRSPAADSFTVVEYTHRIHSDYTYVAHAVVGTWVRDLQHALASGKRVVVPCMTKTMAENLATRFSRTYTTQVYTGGGGNAGLLAAHMADVHTHWSKVQLLIYSPVITAGVSYELHGKDECGTAVGFDVLFFYGYRGLGSVLSANQMTARVRDIASRTVHVFVGGPGPDPNPIAPLKGVGAATFLEDACAAPGDPRDNYLRLLAKLDRYRAEHDANARTAFAYYFWALVVQSGARITFPRADLLAESKAAAKRADSAAVSVASAAPLSTTPDIAGLEEEEDATGAVASAEATDDTDAASGSASAPCCLRPVAKETWLMHDWSAGTVDAPTHRTAGVQATGTLLQRVHALHPQRAMDTGLMPRLTAFDDVATLTRGPRMVSSTGRSAASALANPDRVDLPEWVTDATMAQTRAWVALVAQKAVSRPGGKRVLVRATAPLPTDVPDNTVAAYSPAILALARFAPQTVHGLCAPHVVQYLDPTASVMATARDAWVVAAIDVATRAGVPVTDTALTPLPGSAFSLVTQIADRVQAALARFVAIFVNVPVGVNTPAAAVLDYVGRDRHGEYHAVTVRAAGDALTDGTTDVLKTLAMAVHLPVRVASVRVAYLLQGEVISARLDSGGSGLYDPAPLRWATVCQQARYAAWDPDESVLYGVGVCEGRTLGGSSDDESDSESDAASQGATPASSNKRQRTTSMDDRDHGEGRALPEAASTLPLYRYKAGAFVLATAADVTPATHVVVWGQAGLAVQPPCPTVNDLRRCVASRLNAAPELLALDHVRPVFGNESTTHAGADSDSDSDSSARTHQLHQLRDAYLSVCDTGSVVYFWNNRPWGIPIRGMTPW